MESTSISDVRRMCQYGAFRAYVQGGKVFLEDTATGQVVPLNGESGPANTERRAAPHREDRRGSRVERMFGARDTWKSAGPRSRRFAPSMKHTGTSAASADTKRRWKSCARCLCTASAARVSATKPI